MMFVNTLRKKIQKGSALIFTALTLITYPAQAQNCPADYTGDDYVDLDDLYACMDAFGDCTGTPTCDNHDVNGDGMIDCVELAYTLENWGPCPSNPIGQSELFDQIVVVTPEICAAEVPVIVTHVYATGDDVSEGDRMLMFEASIDALGATTFYQYPPPLGGNSPPDSSDVENYPELAFDTFVTSNALVDYNGPTSCPDSVSITTTEFMGEWFATSPERDAVDISDATGIPGQCGVLIAQISLDIGSDPNLLEYAGYVRLYTSSDDDGSMQGVDAPVYFAKDACPADLTGDGAVDQNDLFAMLSVVGYCPGCPEDINGDDYVTSFEMQYVLDSWGPCGSIALPQFADLFDEVVVVNATDAEAISAGLWVTHVYATGSDVAEGDRLIGVDFADISAMDTTQFFQEPIVGGNFPPDYEDILVEPLVMFDTFVTMGVLVDSDEVVNLNLGMSETSIAGDWLVASDEQRSAVDISDETGNPDQYGVLIAQITMHIASSPQPGYSGSARIYTSPFDCGSLQSLDVPIVYVTPPCPGDFTGDGQVNIDDVFAVLGLWGPCDDPCPPYCTGDLTEDCLVNIDDIFAILGMWGPCE